MVTKDFLKDVLRDKKKLLEKDNVRECNVPHYPEISVARLYEHYKNDEKVAIYLPDKMAKGKVPCRNYFFGVLNTIRPEHVKQIIEHARKQRFNPTDNPD